MASSHQEFRTESRKKFRSDIPDRCSYTRKDTRYVSFTTDQICGMPDLQPVSFMTCQTCGILYLLHFSLAAPQTCDMSDLQHVRSVTFQVRPSQSRMFLQICSPVYPSGRLFQAHFFRFIFPDPLFQSCFPDHFPMSAFRDRMQTDFPFLTKRFCPNDFYDFSIHLYCLQETSVPADHRSQLMCTRFSRAEYP